MLVLVDIQCRLASCKLRWLPHILMAERLLPHKIKWSQPLMKIRIHYKTLVVFSIFPCRFTNSKHTQETSKRFHDLKRKLCDIKRTKTQVQWPTSFFVVLLSVHRNPTWWKVVWDERWEAWLLNKHTYLMRDIFHGRSSVLEVGSRASCGSALTGLWGKSRFFTVWDPFLGSRLGCFSFFSLAVVACARAPAISRYGR